MLEKYTDADLYNFERRCLDLTHQNELQRANSNVLLMQIRLEIERRVMSIEQESHRHRLYLATR